MRPISSSGVVDVGSNSPASVPFFSSTIRWLIFEISSSLWEM
jgi:hypothetical protein